MKFKIEPFLSLLFGQYTFAESVASYPVAVELARYSIFLIDTIQENRCLFEQASYLDESKLLLSFFHVCQ